jgi:ubiquinone/menaquinone biosynthesis C-methylase UbiE
MNKMDEFDRNLFPPKRFQIMNYTENNFTAIGRNHFDYFVKELGLKPTDDVLEIGSGNGRIASSLTSYLESGSYIGVDIMKPFIKWCQKAYSNYDRFSFKHINIYNKFYNKFAFKKSRDFKFPFEDRKFDFIYLTSVFTHMHSEDVDNYLSEINRMLKPGGCVFITYFLIDEETKKLMEEGKSTRKFIPYTENSYTDKPKNPESAIAFDKMFIEFLYSKNNMKITDLSFGKWRFPELHKSLSHNQDRIVAVKI